MASNNFTDKSLKLDNFHLISDNIRNEINKGTYFSYEKEDSIQNYEQESTITTKSNISKDNISDEFINNTNTNIVKKTDKCINKKILIDVAVLCQEYTTVETMCDDNIINLDEISISTECFQQIFYPYCENFGINKEYVCCNEDLYKYISFLPEYRNVCGKKFYLLEAIISNIEKDLNISRNCFTKESLVELTNEMICIKSLCDINCCSVLASLTWCNIIDIINNYKLIKICNCKCHVEKDCKINCGCDHTCSFCEVIPILVINIIFKTPTDGVRNTIVRFNYRITNL
jgi:hypothetical protein